MIVTAKIEKVEEMAYSESNLECTTRDTWNMEQAKWQPVLMLKKSKKLQCRRFWHCSRS